MKQKYIYFILLVFVPTSIYEEIHTTTEDTLTALDQSIIDTFFDVKNSIHLQPEHKIEALEILDDSNVHRTLIKATNDAVKKEDSDESDILNENVENAVKYGLEKVQELLTIKEPMWYKMGLYLEDDHPASKVAAFGKPNKRAIELSKFGMATLEASKKIMEKFSSKLNRQADNFLSSAQSRLLQAECPLTGEPKCPPASKRYRTADGTCNNLEKPWKGSSMKPMQRFILPVYDDGIQEIRRSVLGPPLPSARRISQFIHRDKNVEMKSITLMFMQWGQFIDHDITSAVKSRSFNGSVPRCCDRGGQEMLPPEITHPACLPIEVPREDHMFRQFGITCMEFIRSAPSTRINCDFGWREQINQVTPFIDASTIYGSDVETSDSIRTFRNGKLFYGPLQSSDGQELCSRGALTSNCFEAGDGRASEQPGLVALHTVWIRFHNKLATVLSRHNSHWSDEKVFQETRRIVYSVVQHITYREFLPIVLGPEVMDLFELKLKEKGFYEDYDTRVNPAIANSFAAAAYRFGHSMVQNSFIRTDSDHRPLANNVPLHEDFDNDDNIWAKGSVDRILLGFCNQMTQRRDEFVCDELSNRLFQPKGAPFGMDLPAINIQRGRDHGIPSYTSWRVPCGLKEIESWKDLEKVFSVETAKRFKAVYRHIDDIDLFSGGLAEKPVRGGVVGPTFACIIAQQFLNLRKGDRFWYENGRFESSFTKEQLEQIRRVSLAKVMCQTMNSIETIQPFIFLAADNFKNARVPCDSDVIEDFDLRPWIENSEDNVRNRLNFFRFMGERAKRSAESKISKNYTRVQSQNSKKNLTKGISPHTSASGHKTKYSDSVLKSKENEQINISISGFSTPLPYPIEINVKIHNKRPTNDRLSTVTKRRPSARPSQYDQLNGLVRPNKPAGGIYLRPTTSSNQYNDIVTLTKPVGGTFGRPTNSYDTVADDLPHFRPTVNHYKPVNTYETSSDTLSYPKPPSGLFSKPNNNYGEISTPTSSFIYNDGLPNRPLNRPSSYSEIVQRPISSGPIYVSNSHEEANYDSGNMKPLRPTYSNNYYPNQQNIYEANFEQKPISSLYNDFNGNGYTDIKYKPTNIGEVYSQLSGNQNQEVDGPHKPNFGQYYNPYEYPKKRQPNRKHYTTGDIQELNDRRIEDQLDFKLNLGRNSRELRNKTRSFTKFFENGTERNYDNLIKSNEDVTSSEDLGKSYSIVYNNTQQTTLSAAEPEDHYGNYYTEEIPKPLVRINDTVKSGFELKTNDT